ncbi:Maintenance of telomere capping protein 4 [Spathaspora sp. JA1]|nr:Maintenance of telomere capping protein 4 [Spathaspora sp. JA1]
MSKAQQRVTSGNSILSSLRLSRVETPPPESLKRQKSKHQDDKTPQYNEVKPRKKPAGFDLDITVEDVIQSKSRTTGKSQPSKEEVKKAGELTNLFLDTRNTLRADCNIIDPVSQDSPSSPKEINLTGPVGKYSRNTMVRAEKVKTMIGMKYLYIQRIFEWNESHGSNNEHPGVEGIYNPLQILRNRKIRAKYKEFPKPLPSKTIPLACIVFSKHNQSSDGRKRKRPWRMVWAIDLNEFVSDSRWRVRHWHELENSNGQLWFPSSTQPPEHKSKRKKLQKRLHDKLFSESDAEQTEKKSHYRSSSIITSASSDSDINLIKITPAKSARKKSIRNKMKKFYQGSAGGNSSIGGESSSVSSVNFITGDIDEDRSSEGNLLSTQMFKPVGSILQSGSSSSNDVEQELQSSLSPPIIKIEGSEVDLGVHDVEFLPKRTSVTPGTPDATDDDEQEEDVGNSLAELSEEAEYCNIIQQDQEFSKIVKDVDYLYQIATIRTNYLLSTYPNYLDLIQSKLNSITEHQTFNILRQMSNINDEHLPVYEELYSGFLEEIKSIIHMVNDNYSVKIDSLLSSSDRGISEINASLSLELRKVNERLDNLDESLPKTIRPSDVHLKEETNYKILYFCLENFIIILLRFIWVMVNIFKGGAILVKLIWRMIRFFFD